MKKTQQLGFRLPPDEANDLRRVAGDECRTETDIARASIRLYVMLHDERKAFLESVERGWYQLQSGVGRTEEEHAQFYDELEKEISE